MKLSKEQIIIGVGWLAFQGVFWFLGKPHTMGPLTAFLGVNLITVVYGAGVWYIQEKILAKKG